MASETTEQGAEGTRGGPLGWWTRATEFFKEVRSEMKRVTWPSRREVYATTLVVILTSVFFGLYLFAVDLAWSSAVNWVIRRFGTAAGGA
jgi:preprotein translocase subunit SecE